MKKGVFQHSIGDIFDRYLSFLLKFRAFYFIFEIASNIPVAHLTKFSFWYSTQCLGWLYLWEDWQYFDISKAVKE